MPLQVVPVDKSPSQVPAHSIMSETDERVPGSYVWTCTTPCECGDRVLIGLPRIREKCLSCGKVKEFPAHHH